MARMCSKCGINPPRTPQSSICSPCARLGAKAPVNPEAAAAAAQHDKTEGNRGSGRTRPKLTQNKRMRAAAAQLQKGA